MQNGLIVLGHPPTITEGACCAASLCYVTMLRGWHLWEVRRAARKLRKELDKTAVNFATGFNKE